MRLSLSFSTYKCTRMRFCSRPVLLLLMELCIFEVSSFYYYYSTVADVSSLLLYFKTVQHQVPDFQNSVYRFTDQFLINYHFPAFLNKVGNFCMFIVRKKVPICILLRKIQIYCKNEFLREPGACFRPHLKIVTKDF